MLDPGDKIEDARADRLRENECRQDDRRETNDAGRGIGASEFAHEDKDAGTVYAQYVPGCEGLLKRPTMTM